MGNNKIPFMPGMRNNGRHSGFRKEPRDVADRAVLEQRSQGNRLSKSLLNTFDQLDRHQRVAAQVEEIVVNSDALKTHNIAPDELQKPLDGLLWPDEFRFQFRPRVVWHGQGATVDLARGR
jgi:hypothetical protein